MSGPAPYFGTRRFPRQSRPARKQQRLIDQSGRQLQNLRASDLLFQFLVCAPNPTCRKTVHVATRLAPSRFAGDRLRCPQAPGARPRVGVRSLQAMLSTVAEDGFRRSTDRLDVLALTDGSQEGSMPVRDRHQGRHGVNRAPALGRTRKIPSPCRLHEWDRKKQRPVACPRGQRQRTCACRSHRRVRLASRETLSRGSLDGAFDATARSGGHAFMAVSTMRKSVAREAPSRASVDIP